MRFIRGVFADGMNASVREHEHPTKGVVVEVEEARVNEPPVVRMEGDRPLGDYGRNESERVRGYEPSMRTRWGDGVETAGVDTRDGPHPHPQCYCGRY
jgi:hypothetical protein